MRISDWSSDVCSSDLLPANHHIASRIDPVNLDNALRKIDPKPDSLSHGRPPSVGCYTPSMARLMPSGGRPPIIPESPRERTAQGSTERRAFPERERPGFWPGRLGHRAEERRAGQEGVLPCDY